MLDLSILMHLTAHANMAVLLQCGALYEPNICVIRNNCVDTSFTNRNKLTLVQSTDGS